MKEVLFRKFLAVLIFRYCSIDGIDSYSGKRTYATFKPLKKTKKHKTKRYLMLNSLPVLKNSLPRWSVATKKYLMHIESPVQAIET